MHVQALVAQARVERFDVRVVGLLSRPREIELDTAIERPRFRLSTTLESAFCIEAVEEAIARYGAPERFNRD